MENKKMVKSKELKKIPPALPANIEDWHLATKTKPNIINDVQSIHVGTMKEEDHETYVKYLNAVHNEQSVEGSVLADRLEAAAIIRDKAAQSGFNSVANASKMAIARALESVLRRYQLSRKQRLAALNGGHAPDTPDAPDTPAAPADTVNDGESHNAE